MRKIRDVLRLKLQAQPSHERTAAALHISKGVVTKYVTLASEAGLVTRWVNIVCCRTRDQKGAAAPKKSKAS